MGLLRRPHLNRNIIILTNADTDRHTTITTFYDKMKHGSPQVVLARNWSSEGVVAMQNIAYNTVLIHFIGTILGSTENTYSSEFICMTAVKLDCTNKGGTHCKTQSIKHIQHKNTKTQKLHAKLINACVHYIWTLLHKKLVAQQAQNSNTTN